MSEQSCLSGKVVSLAFKRAGRGWLWLGIGLGICIIAAVAGFIVLNNGGAEGTVSQPARQTAATTKPVAPKELNGKYFMLTYSGVYSAQDNNAHGTGTLEQYFFIAPSKIRKHLAISIESLPSGNLNDESSYRTRQLHPADYTPSSQTVGAGQAAIMTGSGEVTAFLVRGGRAAVISLTSGQADDDMTAEIKALLASFTWKSS